MPPARPSAYAPPLFLDLQYHLNKIDNLKQEAIQQLYVTTDRLSAKSTALLTKPTITTTNPSNQQYSTNPSVTSTPYVPPAPPKHRRTASINLHHMPLHYRSQLLNPTPESPSPAVLFTKTTLKIPSSYHCTHTSHYLVGVLV